MPGTKSSQFPPKTCSREDVKFIHEFKGRSACWKISAHKYQDMERTSRGCTVPWKYIVGWHTDCATVSFSHIQERYFAFFIREIGYEVKSLWRFAFIQRDWPFIFATSEARQGATALLSANIIVRTRVRQTLYYITSNHKRVVEYELFQSMTNARMLFSSPSLTIEDRLAKTAEIREVK